METRALIMDGRYWFRPARFWKWFAFYYPASKEGWIVTGILLATGIAIFLFGESRSDSISDALIGFVPWFVALASVLDLPCFRRGEYPDWWRDRATGESSEKSE